MDLEGLKQAKCIVTGTKQTAKAVANDTAQHVFIAEDADKRVVQPVLDSCSRKGVSVTFVASMEELGKSCCIKVNAAMAAILKED